MIHFIVPAAHDRMVREYLEFWGRDVAPRMRVLHVESLPSRTQFARGVYVLAALDQLTPPMAAFVRALHTALAAQEGVRFLNHPTRSLQRFALLEELNRRGCNEFRAVPATADLRSLRYPVFVRDESAHDGALSPLLSSPAAVQGAIGKAILQGRSARHLLVVEFCDTADRDGYYRKYSSFIVGDRILPRMFNYSRSWMLKFQGSEFSRSMVEEERDYVLGNPHAAALREVFGIAGVQYGRIDYAMKDGRLQTWEINLNPTIGRGLRPSSGNIPAELDAIRKPLKEHFYRGFREAWEAVDVDARCDDPIDVAIEPAIVAAALAPVGTEDSGWLMTLRRLARPAKPVIAPLVAGTLPLVGWVARHRARSASR